MSERPLQGFSGYGGLLPYNPTTANNILYIESVKIINIWSLNLLNIRNQDKWSLSTVMWKVNGSTVAVCTNAASGTSLNGVNILRPKVTLLIS